MGQRQNIFGKTGDLLILWVVCILIPPNILTHSLFNEKDNFCLCNVHHILSYKETSLGFVYFKLLFYIAYRIIQFSLKSLANHTIRPPACEAMHLLWVHPIILVAWEGQVQCSAPLCAACQSVWQTGSGWVWMLYRMVIVFRTICIQVRTAVRWPNVE